VKARSSRLLADLRSDQNKPPAGYVSRAALFFLSAYPERSMPKIDIASAPIRKGSSYPAPFAEKPAARIRHALGDAGRLSDFGVNLIELPPGAWLSQRHWHSTEDEFVYVISGDVTDDGEEVLGAGDRAAFPKNTTNGHHLINKTNALAVCLEAGSRSSDDVTVYSDIDLKIDARDNRYTHKDGTPY
jgi:uncharacterized cupin superfamily protein